MVCLTVKKLQILYTEKTPIRILCQIVNPQQNSHVMIMEGIPNSPRLLSQENKLQAVTNFSIM